LARNFPQNKTHSPGVSAQVGNIDALPKTERSDQGVVGVNTFKPETRSVKADGMNKRNHFTCASFDALPRPRLTLRSVFRWNFHFREGASKVFIQSGLDLKR
jgi:hypothetical protein